MKIDGLSSVLEKLHLRGVIVVFELGYHTLKFNDGSVRETVETSCRLEVSGFCSSNSKASATGLAYLAPQDRFNADFGRAVSLGRALRGLSKAYPAAYTYAMSTV